MRTAKKTGISERGAMVLLGYVLKAAQEFPALRKRVRLERRSPKRSWTVELNLVGAPAMKRLNLRYRRKNYATDVLSFPAPEVFREHGFLGELVICGPVLERQAREQNHSPKRELEVLLVHGVLHLLGFDHEEGVKQAAEMARWENKLLAMRGSGSQRVSSSKKRPGASQKRPVGTAAGRFRRIEKPSPRTGLISRSSR